MKSPMVAGTALTEAIMPLSEKKNATISYGIGHSERGKQLSLTEDAQFRLEPDMSAPMERAGCHCYRILELRWDSVAWKPERYANERLSELDE
ncbi:hypothetical protein MRX96_039908 [Rhipicephalus microplus]